MTTVGVPSVVPPSSVRNATKEAPDATVLPSKLEVTFVSFCVTENVVPAALMMYS